MNWGSGGEVRGDKHLTGSLRDMHAGAAVIIRHKCGGIYGFMYGPSLCYIYPDFHSFINPSQTKGTKLLTFKYCFQNYFPGSSSHNRVKGTSVVVFRLSHRHSADVYKWKIPSSQVVFEISSCRACIEKEEAEDDIKAGLLSWADAELLGF